jgi:hypothetical protein
LSESTGSGTWPYTRIVMPEKQTNNKVVTNSLLKVNFFCTEIIMGVNEFNRFLIRV